MDRRETVHILRREFSGIGWALMIYAAIMNMAVPAVAIGSAYLQYAMLPANSNVTFDALVEYQLLNNGWGYLVAALMGVFLMLMWKKGQFCFHTIWKAENPMKVGSFIMLLCLFISGQTVFLVLSTIMEMLFNTVGITIQDSVESASTMGDTFSMFLYIGVVAPITEELFFRGLILRSLEPFGKRFAILGSAFLFGIFHTNIIQSPYAFAVGLVLGYTAATYHIGWAMVLHMANNMLLGDTLSRISRLLPAATADILFAAIVYGCTVVAILTLVKKRREIREYFRTEPLYGVCVQSFFTSPGVLVLTIAFGAIVLSGLISQLFV